MAQILSSITQRLPHILFLILLSFGLGLLTASLTEVTTAAPCSVYTSTTVPNGYAPPMNVFTNELMVTSDCGTVDTSVFLGKRDANGAPQANLAVYKLAHVWYPDREVWGAFSLRLSPPQGISISQLPDWTSAHTIDQNYYRGYVETGNDIPYVSNPTYYVTYFCHDVLSGSSFNWKCGCTDTQCTNSKWVLQAHHNPNRVATGASSGGRVYHICDAGGCYECSTTGCRCTSGACLSGSSSGGLGSSSGISSSGVGSSSGGQPPDPTNVRMCYSGTGTRVVRVTNAGELQSAITNAKCGDEIIADYGVYAGTYNYTQVCQATNPVVVRSQPAFAAKLSGNLNLAGSSFILEGFTIHNGGHIDIRGATHRITRNFITGEASAQSITIHGGGRNSRIDHNEFNQTYGPSRCGITDTVTCIDIYFNMRAADNPKIQNIRIDHNYFKGGGGARYGDDNAIYISTFYIGLENYGNTGNLVEYNLFENWPKQGVVHIKSDGNTIQYNHVKGGVGRLDVRNGKNNVLQGNRLEGGAEKIAIMDVYNSMIGNYAGLGTSIYVWAYEDQYPADNIQKPGSLYPAADNALVEGNTGELTVGKVFSSTAQIIRPVRYVTVRGHNGPIKKDHVDLGTYTESSSRTTSITPVAPLTTTQVGVTALDPNCSSGGGSSSSGGAVAGNVTWISGMSVHASYPPAPYEAWLGRSAGHYTIWQGIEDRGTWDQMRSATDNIPSGSQLATTLNSIKGKSGTVSIGVGMIPTQVGNTANDGYGRLDQCADGSHDSIYTSFAQSLKDAGFGNAILRIGWEANGNWYPWGMEGPTFSNGKTNANTLQQYHACFRKMVNLFRTVSPNFKIEWTMTNDDTPMYEVYPIAQFYPGDAYVDIIGVDFYDGNPGLVNQTVWDANYALYGQGKWPRGIGSWLAFAKSHGKKLAVPEWAIRVVSGNGSTDAVSGSFFVQKMYDFFNANKASIYYESYFNSFRTPPTHNVYPINLNPNTSLRYKTLFGR